MYEYKKVNLEATKKFSLFSLTAFMFIVLLLSGCASQKEAQLSPMPAVAQYDSDGNLIVPPEVKNTYIMPDVHAGYAYIATTRKVTPVLEIEIYQCNLPLISETNLCIGAGNDAAFLSINKVWTSIYEISTGVLFGRDFEEDTWIVGVEILVIKF